MHFEHNPTKVLDAAVSLFANERLDGLVGYALSGVVSSEHAFERRDLQGSRLSLVKHGDLRIEPQLVEMLADEFQTKAVKRADVGSVEQGELFFEPLVAGP